MNLGKRLPILFLGPVILLTLLLFSGNLIAGGFTIHASNYQPATPNPALYKPTYNNSTLTNQLAALRETRLKQERRGPVYIIEVLILLLSGAFVIRIKRTGFLGFLIHLVLAIMYLIAGVVAIVLISPVIFNILGI